MTRRLHRATSEMPDPMGGVRVILTVGRRQAGSSGWSVISTLVVCVGMITGPVRARVHFVDADAPGPVHDGSSWANAFRSFSAALDAASEWDTLRVAEGTYTPDPSGLLHPRGATFDLPDSTVVIGGYAGWGVKDPNENDPDRYRTVLSGDLAGNDRTSGDTSENAYHVVTVTSGDPLSAPRLAGFTIIGGNANGIGFPGDATGGGVYTTGPIAIEDCVLEGNNAKAGGGMFNMESTPVISRCMFRENTADQGGGVFLFGFETRGQTGQTSDTIILLHGSPRVTESVFVGNHARDKAGAVWISGIAENLTMTGCRFTRNTAINDAGAVWASGGTHAFTNCLFSYNVAGAAGGAVHTDSILELSNCTLAGNEAVLGGGVFSRVGSPSLTGCILWGNRTSSGSGELAQIESAFPPNVAFCCIDGWTGTWGGAANFGDDPLFIPGPIGCYYLSDIATGHATSSPCIDSGQSDVATARLAAFTTSSSESVDVGTVDIGYHYPVTGLPLLAGDADFNGRRDLIDFAAFQNCFTGGSGAAVPPCCRTFDFHFDGDVHLDDLHDFAGEMNGP